MNCHSCQELMVHYLANELDEDNNEKIKQHLESCKKCREVLKEYQVVENFLHKWDETEVPKELSEKLYIIPDQKITQFILMKRIPRWAIAASIIFSFVLGILTAQLTFTNKTYSWDEIYQYDQSLTSYWGGDYNE